MKAPTVVSFHGHNLLTIKDDNDTRVAMRPICEGIGLAWNGQLERIKRHPVLSQGVRVIRTPSNGGDQQHTTLPLEMLNGWLFGIDANRVKPEIRETLLMYQRECFKVLFEHFHPQRVESCTLTHEHQRGLQKEISKRVYASVKPEQRRKAFPAIHRYLKDRFGVASYKDIPESKYTQALAAVESAPLEGVYIKHSAPQQEEGGMWLDSIGINRIQCLCAHFDALHNLFYKYDLYRATKALGSRAGIEMIDHIKDGTSPSHYLQMLLTGSSRYDRPRIV